MNYDEFINAVNDSQTKQVKALSILNCCSMAQIPSTFLAVVSDIVHFIHLNIRQFCNENEVIGVFGLQIAAMNLQSELPLTLRRINLLSGPQSHFCCTLSYMVAPCDQLDKISSWQNYRSIVIDFTSGTVMCPEHYLYLLEMKKTPGKIFGELSQEILNKMWQSIPSSRVMN